MQPYPVPGARRRLTATGIQSSILDSLLHWSADGRELLLVGDSGEVVAFPLEPGGDVRPEAGRVLFHMPPDVMGVDATPNHRPLLVTVPMPDTVPAAIAVDSNWAAGLGK